jgi:hypothetical protein
VDVIESGSSRPPRRIGAGAALILVVVAALVGYLVGRAHQTTPATPAAPAPSAPPSSAAAEDAVPLTLTGKRCSVQTKDRLQLGIEIVNESPAAATLRKIDAVLPMEGLRARATSWGACGQLSSASGADSFRLAAGATTWMSIAFEVLAACPGALPVKFTVQYEQGGSSGTALLAAFPDLGDVPYTSSRCPTGS